MKRLAGKVVVVTGASSGLGRETAVQFAARGCPVVLAARGLEGLEETARLCRARGGTALVVLTDVTREAEVQRLALQTLEHFGRIDVWVNNAGVTLFSLLEDAPTEAHLRVIETNLYGSMYGARAVVPIFRRQRNGVLINVGSLLSKIGQPYVPSYVISKFALRGMSEALRTEFADEPDIHVCTVLPYAIDTPHFEGAANEVGREAWGMPPIQSPERVARAIVRLAAHPRRERHVPRAIVLGLALHFALPRTTERLLLHTLAAWHVSGRAQQRTPGNLSRPSQPRAGSHGSRRPQLSTPAMAAWAVRELGRIEAQSVRRRVGRSMARVRSLAQRSTAAPV